MQTLGMLMAVLASLVVGDERIDPNAARQRVDLIELNHFIDDQGREVFRQLIFYDWSKSQRRYHVRAWRLVKQPRELPQRRWDPPHYQCTWHDEQVMRQVWSTSFRETWSQDDPERVNRKQLPEDQRVPLWRRPSPTVVSRPAG